MMGNECMSQVGQLKVKGRDRFDICCKSQMQSFGNWLDVKGEGEEESKLNPSFQFE